MEGIWSSKKLGEFNPLPKRVYLTCGEGNTPFKFVELPGHQLLGIKDENENPNGSFKDRSLAYQLSCYLDQGLNKFVISSSGNAAIAAAALCSKADADLDVFVSEHINTAKLFKLEEITARYLRVRIHKSNQPKSDAIKFTRENNLINLRGSQDDLAVTGFKTIAYELVEQYPQIDSVFIPCSSGTSTLALCQAFKEMQMQVKVFSCQTVRIHPIASAFITAAPVSETSLADAISDRVALRKDAVVNALRESGGGACIISDEELREAKIKLEQYGFQYSYNSLLGFAGFFKMHSPDLLHPVVIASGL